MTPEAYVDASRFAREVLRRWRLAPAWLDGAGPADDESLPVASRLRRLRQLQALRIQWREQCGRHDIEQTGRALSTLASDCLELALAEAERRVAERHGRLFDADGTPARLALLALGKLGGDELNFNSDLDLVYCHAAVGESDGARRLPAREYFARVCRELAALMEQVTAEGRVWVLDTRLRPFGQAGALVWSVDAMEQYFINEGRVWERYAWLKARAVAGEVAVGEALIERIRPFVFRRYLDYGLFDSLRELHGEIDQRSRREDLSADIKRGPGGIRELEFVIQSLQLLRGGREPGLRRSGFLPALRAARRARLLGAGEARGIDRSYRFLRALENRIQLATGRQTHEMPDDESLRTGLAALMGLGSPAALDARVDQVRKAVRDLFASRFEAPAARAPVGPALWPPPDEGLQDRLAELGFRAPEQAAAGLRRLHTRLARRPLSAEGRRRLERLMPELLAEVVDHQPPDTGLEQLLALIETIAQRSVYLALLHERPITLTRCVRVFRASARVADWIIASPQLLDDLLAPDAAPELPLMPQMQSDDVEASLNALAAFRQAGFLRTAVAQLDGRVDRAAARQRLTGLAEQVLAAMAGLYLDGNAVEPAIIGYGNLGAAELHYSSDLDLVFLHAADDAPTRVVQRLINAMQLPLPGGKLYEVDTRLRPNGNAGMLVSSIDSFADYQRRHAWIWEHQALIRARYVAGPEPLAGRFEEIRAEVLARPRDARETAEALADMRRRQLRQRRESGEKRLLGDIQFIAELGVLLTAADAPRLMDARSTLDQLDALVECGWLEAATGARLKAAFERAATLRDRRFLERDCDDDLDADDRAAVDAVWRERVAPDGPPRRG